MSTTVVYDWPTRLFHWMFAGLFVIAFAIANLLDDDSASFPLHMLAGLAMCSVIVLRLVWSVIGTRHARVSDLVLNPLQLAAYFRGMLSGSTGRWAGHNPASSWAAVLMVGMGLGLGVTGYLMANGGNEALKDVHELLANAFLATVVLHLGGLLVHALRHRDALAMSMVNGRKRGLAASTAPVSSRPWQGVAFLWLAGACMAYLLLNYQADTRTLQFLGRTLQLGEAGETGAEAGEEASGLASSGEDEDD